VPPKFHHSRLQYAIAELVNQFTMPRRLASAFTELRTTFAGASLVPDVAVYVWSRIPLDADGELAEDALEPPDITVEILSPGQSVRSLRDKCLWFVEKGVDVSILVNPRNRTVTSFRPGIPPVTFRDTDVLDLGDVIPGFQVTIQQIFGALRFS
jgi:Uma2 family endonuclease